MYLYASEHALMDYHLNEEKRNKEKVSAELPELPVVETETAKKDGKETKGMLETKVLLKHYIMFWNTGMINTIL